VKASRDVSGPEQCVHADLGGRFAFTDLPGTTNRVVASARGYVSQQRAIERLSTAPESVELVLEPAREHVYGHVVDASGGFVTGAVITLRASADAVVGATLSGSDGAFEIARVPGADDLCAQAEMYSRTCSSVGDPAAEQVLILTQESRIVGRVLTHTAGRAVVGASVVASNRNGLQIPARSVSSGEDGYFEIEGLPAGGYEVVAVSKNARSNEQWVALGLGETSAPVTLLAAPAVRVSGVVLVEGEPCRRGGVNLLGPIVARQAASGDGTVQLDGVVPGRYEATAHCDGAIAHSVLLDVQTEPLEHVWTLGTLPGRSAPRAGKEPGPPGGGTLRVMMRDEPTAGLAAFAESRDGLSQRGRRHGSTFVFEALPVGEYRVYVNDYVEQAQSATISRDGELVEVPLPSAAPGWISGQVLSDQGLAVPDAWVSAMRAGSPLAPALAPVLTDETGAFQLPAVPGAPYTLTVASPSGDARLEEVKAGEELSIRVLAPASLSGKVLTSEGKEVPDFTLRYREARAAQSDERRGAHSRFHLSALRPGAYWVEVSSALGSAGQEVQLAPRESATLTMILGGAEHPPR
jgi:hypothetical protein